MTIKNLEKKIKEYNIPKNAYSLNGGLPNESYCIDFINNNWEVYYSERGLKTEKKVFLDENTACEYFLNILKSLTNWQKGINVQEAQKILKMLNTLHVKIQIP